VVGSGYHAGDPFSGETLVGHSIFREIFTTKQRLYGDFEIILKICDRIIVFGSAAVSRLRCLQGKGI